MHNPPTVCHALNALKNCDRQLKNIRVKTQLWCDNKTKTKQTSVTPFNPTYPIPITHALTTLTLLSCFRSFISFEHNHQFLWQSVPGLIKSLKALQIMTFFVSFICVKDFLRFPIYRYKLAMPYWVHIACLNPTQPNPTQSNSTEQPVNQTVHSSDVRWQMATSLWDNSTVCISSTFLGRLRIELFFSYVTIFPSSKHFSDIHCISLFLLDTRFFLMFFANQSFSSHLFLFSLISLAFVFIFLFDTIYWDCYIAMKRTAVSQPVGLKLFSFPSGSFSKSKIVLGFGGSTQCRAVGARTLSLQHNQTTCGFSRH